MKKLNLFLIIISFLLSMNINANASLFDDAKASFDKLFSPTPEQVNSLSYESFDGTTFPPTGWTQEVYNYSNSWTRGTIGGNPYCMPHSGLGMARISTALPQNVVDHTWLITPSFSLTGGQGLVTFWMYRSVDAPGAPDSLGVWVNTVPDSAGVNFTWLGQIRRASSSNGWYQYTFLIPASFNGATNYILFGAYGFGGGNIYLDDVGFGVPVNMTFVSSSVSVNTNPVQPNTRENQVINIPVTVAGNLNPINISNFNLRTFGTSNPSNDIRNAKIYYTGTYNTFTTSSQYATLYGNVVVNPNGSFSINGSQSLVEGTNYFWLTYDVTSGAIQGDTISAVCDSINGTGMSTIFPTPASSGGRIIYTAIPGGSYIIGPGQTAPNYPTFTSAFADLSLRGINGPVLFNVRPGVYGTDAGIDVDSTIILNNVFGASTTNTITFKKKSDETGEVWIERRGTTTLFDNIVVLNGASFITFDSINVRQKDSAIYNGVAAGYVLKNSSPVIGCSYNTIRNAKIYLKASNINSTGIKDTLAVTPPTNFSGVNSYNKYQNNIFLNCYSGIKLNGYSSGTQPYYTNGRYNEITGNTITGFGGLATAAYGIFTNYEMFIKVANNSLTSSTTSTNSVYGIYIAGSNFGNVDVTSNTVTLTTGVSTAAIGGIYVAGTPGNSGSIRTHCNILNNVLQNFSTPATSSGAFYGIYASGSFAPDTMNVIGNVFKNSTIGTTNATFACFYVSGSSVNLNIANDSVYNIIKNGASSSNYFIYQNSLGSNGIQKIYNNYIANDSITAGTTVYTIYDNSSTSADYSYNFNNTIDNISTGNTGGIYGIYTANAINRFVYNNKINRLKGNYAGTTFIDGIYLGSGQYVYLYNNSISNLRTPSGTSPTGVIGLYINGPVGPSNVGLYYNSMYLADTSSSTAYGNACIYDLDTNRVDIRNNNFVNLSKSGGAAITNSAIALRLSAATILRNSPFTNGNNNWYIGAGSTGQLYYDGTTNYTGLQFNSFMNIMNPREQGSTNENAPFINAYGGNLRINTSTASLTYRGGLPVTSPISITSDYDGNVRNLTYPCIGFNEFSGTSATDIVPPVIIYSLMGNGTTSNRTLSNVTIKDPSGLYSTAAIWYKKSIDANTFNDNTSATAGWKYATGTISGSSVNLTLDYTKLFGGSASVGDTIQYFVNAQDGATIPNVGINSGAYATTPTSIALLPANFPITGTINRFVITSSGTVSNVINVGIGQTITNLTGIGGLFDLMNKGLVTGNITATVTSDLAETGQIGLKAWNESMAPLTYKLKIIPDGTTERLISGYNSYTYNTSYPADSMGLIRFNGANNVTIDGGTGKYLRIRNKSKGAAINFMNGAMFDTVKNCTIEALGDQVTTRLQFSPVIFTKGNVTQGNMYNIVANNVIRERTDTTSIQLYSVIWSEGLGIQSQNAYNTIYGNEIINFSQGGVFISSTSTGNGNGWIIRKNSFYNSLPIFISTQFMPISASLGVYGGLTVDSNFIGGTAANCGGNYMFVMNAGTYYFMSFSTGFDTISTINANTFQNIKSYSGNGSSMRLNGISVTAGWMDIKGNVFGSADTSKTIWYNGGLNLITASNSNTGVIRPVTISNNSFLNIYTRKDSIIDPPQGNIVRNLISISSATAPIEISNNIFSKIYSWQTPTTNNFYFTKLTGITISGSQKIVIKNNSISEIANLSVNSYTGGGKNFVYAIENLGAGDSSSIFNNKINGVYSLNPGGTNDLVAGIINAGGSTYGATNNIYNNQISMGTNSGNSGELYGIYEPNTAFYNSITNYFYNTVFIAGTSSSYQPSYCYFKNTSTAQTANLKDNIFYNARTSPNSKNYAIGIAFYGIDKTGKNINKTSNPQMNGTPTVTSDYNTFIAPSYSSIFDWYGNSYSLNSWNTATGYDPNSIADTTANIPYSTLFRNVSSGNLNIDTTQYGSLYSFRKGSGIQFISNDFNGYPRNISGLSCTGSHEFGLNGNIAVTLVSPSNNSTGIQIPVSMVWTKSLFASGYRIQIATDSLFGNIVATGTPTDSTYSFTGANALTYYWWRVNPVYSTGVNGAYSSVYKFKVIGNPNQVVLYSPANNSTNQTLNLTFKWLKSNDQTFFIKANNNKRQSLTDNNNTIGNYWYEISADSTFTTIFTRDTTLTDTTKSITGLIGFTKYYWRVKSRNQFGWGAFSNVWNLTTLLPVPAVPVLVTPANGSTNVVLSPVLTWSAVQYASTYRMQISTDSTFATTLWDTSGVTPTQVTIPAGKLSYLTTYYWRVNATNTSGTSSFSTFWNFRTSDNTIPLSMSNFVGVSVPKYMTSGTSTRLPVAIRATLQGLIPNKTYRYYNLAAVNTDIGTTTIGAGTILLINSSTQNYTYTATGNLTTSGQFETFTSDVSGSYTGWFAFLNTGNARFTQGNYVIPSITIGDTTGLTLGRYALNDSILVLGFNTTSGPTNGTGIYGISVGLPKNFVAIYDNTAGTGKPLSQSFIESDGITLPSVVQYYTDSVNNFNGRWGSIIPNTLSSGVQRVEEKALSNGSILAFNTSSTGLWPSGANTVNALGGTTAIRLAPGDAPLLNTPVLVTPTNGTLDLTVTPTLTWNSVLTASGYRIQIASDSLFNTTVFDSTGITGTTVSVPSGKLTTNTTYYWRASGYTTVGQGPYSSKWYFTTAPNAPNAPVLLSPANSATGQPVNITFVWRKAIETLNLSLAKNNTKKILTDNVKSKNIPFIDGALTLNKYWFEYSTDSTFTTVTGRDTTVTDTTKSLTGLSNLTKYWWRVKAKNQTGWGTFSSIWNFTTIVAMPTAPTLISPVNGASSISLTPTCIWSVVPNAVTYRFQISTDSSFATTNWDTTGLSRDTVIVPAGKLSEVTRYYWRVNATNAAGTGPWSSKNYFTTLTTALLVNLKVYLEGFWSGSNQISDTVNIYLAGASSPYNLVDSQKVVLGTNGTSALSFSRVTTGNYYIVVKHRNHLETWSANPVALISGTQISYDFTTAATQAYGSNMKQVGTVWVLYGGDPNMDGSIDAIDISVFIPQFGTTGYLSCDFNGDNSVDGLDVQIIVANFGLTKVSPAGAPESPEIRKQNSDTKKKDLYNLFNKKKSNNKIINN